MNVSKEYIQEQYRLAYLDFKTAHNEDEQWSARKQMAKLEGLAAETYGFAFADTLSVVKGQA